MDEITKKEIENIKRNTRIETLGPQVIDLLIEQRANPADYVSTGGGRMVQPDVAGVVTIRGERYVIPLYKLK